MSEEELKRIIFQAHGQDAKALEFMQTQIAALTAKLERARDKLERIEWFARAAKQQINAEGIDFLMDEILREVGR